MCGIAGGISKIDIVPYLKSMLGILEARGYDSAGIVVVNSESRIMQRIREKGNVQQLFNSLDNVSLSGGLGLAHTRWATHGKPTVFNAHPHVCNDERFSVVHNGIIENYLQLKNYLTSQGVGFSSDTDTEVVVHLINFLYSSLNDTFKVIAEVVKMLKGMFAIGIIDSRKDCIYAVKQGAPMVVGIGEKGNFISSDIVALRDIAEKFVCLVDGDIAQITIDDLIVHDKNMEVVNRSAFSFEIDKGDLSGKNGFDYYMLKEINEQPIVIRNLLKSKIVKGEVVKDCFGVGSDKAFSKIKRIQMVACGTSFYACLLGKYWIESLAGIPCSVEIASENIYRKSAVDEDTLFVVVSQSGETADTLLALKNAKKDKYLATLGISNVLGSSVMRLADFTFHTNAGPEIGVAATKTFMSQLASMLLLSLKLKPDINVIQRMFKIPDLLENALKLEPIIKKLAESFKNVDKAIFLSRNVLYPIALEASLKLEEISYIHSSAFPLGELKHGPLAVISPDIPLIVFAPSTILFDKSMSNIKEIQARDGKLIIFSDALFNIKENEDFSIYKVDTVDEISAPFVYGSVAQLFACHVGICKGKNIDQPQNLAKTVTVE